MEINGFGGRGSIHPDFPTEENPGILAGLIGEPDYELLPVRNCVNPKCGRPFRPRAEGDDYCNERCDPYNKLARATEVTHDDLSRKPH